ncbi:MAG: hypothetical protein IPM39_09280 [Chloroflexi bacterium]|nr:hypothetical protein [Chloroflexota bacterium]
MSGAARCDFRYLALLSTPDELWRLTLAELRGQTAVVTFNTWLASSRIVATGCTPSFWVVAVRNEYACDWLSHRFYPTAARTATAVAARPVTLCFIPRYLTLPTDLPYPPLPLQTGGGCSERHNHRQRP